MLHIIVIGLISYYIEDRFLRRCRLEEIRLKRAAAMRPSKRIPVSVSGLQSWLRNLN